MNIGIYCQTKGILCHSKTRIFQKQMKLKKPKFLRMAQKKNTLKKEKEMEKEEEAFHMFIKTEFILVKNLKQGPE